MKTYEDALVIAREVGNRAGEGTTLNNIGLVYDSQGKYEQASKTYEDALVIAREVGNRTGEGAILNNIGAVYKSQGKYEQALNYYRQALVIAGTLGIKPLEKTALENIETLSMMMNETKIEEPAIGDKNKRLNQLRRLYTQHMDNLQKLKEQEALFGAGQTPLHLINQIEVEKKAIEEIQAEMDALIND